MEAPHCGAPANVYRAAQHLHPAAVLRPSQAVIHYSASEQYTRSALGSDAALCLIRRFPAAFAHYIFPWKSSGFVGM